MTSSPSQVLVLGERPRARERETARDRTGASSTWAHAATGAAAEDTTKQGPAREVCVSIAVGGGETHRVLSGICAEGERRSRHDLKQHSLVIAKSHITFDVQKLGEPMISCFGYVPQRRRATVGVGVGMQRGSRPCTAPRAADLCFQQRCAR